MSHKQIIVSGKDLVKVLEKMGFVVTRVNGSHYRMKHNDGRVTTVPVHKNEPIAKGLLRKIIKEDIQMSMEDFEQFFKNNL